MKRYNENRNIVITSYKSAIILLHVRLAHLLPGKQRTVKKAVNNTVANLINSSHCHLVFPEAAPSARG